jgi:hypothetical protein
MRAIEVGEAALYLIGGVAYRDVFDQQRETSIAAVCVGGQMVRHAEGNEAT